MKRPQRQEDGRSSGEREMPVLGEGREERGEKPRTIRVRTGEEVDKALLREQAKIGGQ